MLEVENLSVAYGQHRALENVSINVDQGEIVVILGANGAGKSTLLRTVSGICEGQQSGNIRIDGQSIFGMTSDRIVEQGIALVPEGRGIFGDLSVRENLLLGAYSSRARDDESANLDRVIGLFPKLSERLGQIARTMSGGEQQMVAIGRAMMSNPQILMLDEPSLGLSPLLCKELFQNLTEVRKAGIGILLVEQNAKQSLAIADRGYLLENASITHEDRADNLARDPAVQKAYLGAGSKETRSTTGDRSQVKELAPGDTDNGAKPFRIKPRIEPRQTADQLLGQSVDKLVATAAATSGTTGPGKSILRREDHTTKLQTTISDIENAAAGARLRQEYRRNKPDNSAPKSDVPEKARKPVVVEVYRAPRVEIYRRRNGSSEFERD